VIAVPKKELDKRQAAYERERKKDAKKMKVALSVIAAPGQLKR
jgi:tmRNA-binding protein